MPISEGSARKVVRLSEVAAEPREEVPAEVAGSPLYGVAMLKIAMELKKTESASLDELITTVLTKMKLPEDDFRAFLSANGGLLRSVAMKRRY